MVVRRSLSKSSVRPDGDHSFEEYQRLRNGEAVLDRKRGGRPTATGHRPSRLSGIQAGSNRSDRTEEPTNASSRQNLVRRIGTSGKTARHVSQEEARQPRPVGDTGEGPATVPVECGGCHKAAPSAVTFLFFPKGGAPGAPGHRRRPVPSRGFRSRPSAGNSRRKAREKPYFGERIDSTVVDDLLLLIDGVPPSPDPDVEDQASSSSRVQYRRDAAGGYGGVPDYWRWRSPGDRGAG